MKGFIEIELNGIYKYLKIKMLVHCSQIYFKLDGNGEYIPYFNNDPIDGTYDEISKLIEEAQE